MTTPRKTIGGAILSSSLQLRPRNELRPLDVRKRPLRALVIATRLPDDPDNLRGTGIECDVILVRTQILLEHVPVVQRHGVNNIHGIWTPHPATRTLDNTPLNVQRTTARGTGTYTGPPTSFANTDGDFVLVDFIEANKDFPIIIGGVSHEGSRRKITTGTGWREMSVVERGAPRQGELYTHHYGTELRVNEQGDVLVDTVGAYSDPSTEDVSAQVGQVRIRVKDTQRLTVAIGDDEDVLEVYKDAGQLKIDLGDAADQRLVLGDDQLDALKNLVDALGDFAQALGTATPNTYGAIPVAAAAAAYATLTPQLETGKTALEQALSELARTKRM